MRAFLVGSSEFVIDDNATYERLKRYDILDRLNKLNDENEQLKTQLQNTSDQRDEFHRGARENANRVGKLEKENEQLKKEIEELKWNLELER